MDKNTDTTSTDIRDVVEAEMLTAINIIAGNYGCTVDDVNFDTHVINLSGSKEDEHACAVAIGDYVHELKMKIAKEKAKRFEQDLTGCGEDCAC